MSVQGFLRQKIATTTAMLLAISTSNTFAGNSSSHATDIDHIFAKWGDSTPGCSVGVNEGGHRELAKAYGKADLEHGINNSLDTVFEAGSISKQFTAAAILLLARDGKLSLDDPARKYIPEIPDYAEAPTIRQMLTHTSGLRDWGDIATIEGWPRGTRAYADADLLKIVSRQKELNFSPGTRWSYCNTGYNLSEIIVSRVSGMSLAEFTRQRFFLPLGMTHTSWRDDYTRLVPDRAVAYSRKSDGFHADMPFENIYGNGGLLTTVGDLLKWNEHLSSPDVMDSELIENQQRPYRLNNGRPTDYGYGLFIRKFKAAPEISHTGSTAGYTSFLARYPSQRLSIAMLCNVAEVNTWEYGHAIADIWIGTPVEQQPAHAKAYHLSPAEASRLVGIYRDVLTGRPTTISAEPGKIHFGAYTVMSPVSPTRFYMDEKTVDIAERGMMTVSDVYGVVDRYEHVKAPAPSPSQLASIAGKYTSPEIDSEVTIVPSGPSISVQFGTKTSLILAPAYDNAFSNDSLTVIFSRDGNGNPTAMTVSTERVWNLRLARIDQ
jgi:CubicO group peptidase (beta-lactamase class C family)